LPRAEERKSIICQEIIDLQERVEGAKKSTDIEKYINRLPGIIRKIGELTKKPFTEKDF
jgi:predicted transcriptional regulator